MGIERIPGIKIKKAVIIPPSPMESYVMIEWNNDIFVVQGGETLFLDGDKLSIEFDCNYML